jgi:hypothetical protein
MGVVEKISAIIENMQGLKKLVLTPKFYSNVLLPFITSKIIQFITSSPTVCVIVPFRGKPRMFLWVTGVWAGVDSAWEQKKLEAGKMLVNATREASYLSGACGTDWRARRWVGAGRRHNDEQKVVDGER